MLEVESEEVEARIEDRRSRIAGMRIQNSEDRIQNGNVGAQFELRWRGDEQDKAFDPPILVP